MLSLELLVLNGETHGISLASVLNGLNTKPAPIQPHQVDERYRIWRSRSRGVFALANIKDGRLQDHVLQSQHDLDEVMQRCQGSRGQTCYLLATPHASARRMHASKFDACLRGTGYRRSATLCTAWCPSSPAVKRSHSNSAKVTDLVQQTARHHACPDMHQQ